MPEKKAAALSVLLGLAALCRKMERVGKLLKEHKCEKRTPNEAQSVVVQVREMNEFLTVTCCTGAPNYSKRPFPVGKEDWPLIEFRDSPCATDSYLIELYILFRT